MVDSSITTYKVRYYKKGMKVPMSAFYPMNCLFLYKVRGTSSFILADMRLPYRSNLWKLLTALLSFNSEGDYTVTEDQATLLKTIFNNQRVYQCWKEALSILEKGTKEEVWEWLRDKTPLLKLCAKLRGKDHG